MHASCLEVQSRPIIKSKVKDNHSTHFFCKLFKISLPSSMTGHFRQMFSWILSAAFLASSLVSSLNLPAKGQSISARHSIGMANLQCGPYYGRPSPADCSFVADRIRAFRIDPYGSTDAYYENYDEFIIRGGERQHGNCNMHWFTPFYWRTGPYTWECSNCGIWFADTLTRGV